MRNLGDMEFTGLLVLAAGAATALCLAWLTVIAAAAVLEAWSGGRWSLLHLTGCPPAWRRRLLRVLVPLLAPGLGIVAAPGAAMADPPDASAARAVPRGADPSAHAANDAGGPSVRIRAEQALAGLPLPQLQSAHAARGRGAPLPVAVLEVHPGDTLWGIAARTLPAGASRAAVARRCAHLYRENRATIGPDPDVIRPGQRLLVPVAPAAIRPPSHGLEEEER